MLNLVFAIDGQNVKCINNRRLVSNSKDHVCGEVVLYQKMYFDNNDGPTITAIFWKDDATEYVEVKKDSGTFNMPQEYVSVPGSFKISFRISYGDDSEIITTDRVNIDVVSAGYNEISESDPYQNLLDRVKKLEESISDSADNTDYEGRISELEKSVSVNTSSIASMELRLHLLESGIGEEDQNENR